MLKISFQKYDEVGSINAYNAVADIENVHADAAIAREPFAYVDFGYKFFNVDGKPMKFLSNINIWDRRKENLWVIFATDSDGNSAFEEGTTEYKEFVAYAEKQFSRLIGKEYRF